jgi:hypothetical protein
VEDTVEVNNFMINTGGNNAIVNFDKSFFTDNLPQMTNDQIIPNNTEIECGY